MSFILFMFSSKSEIEHIQWFEYIQNSCLDATMSKVRQFDYNIFATCINVDR